MTAIESTEIDDEPTTDILDERTAAFEAERAHALGSTDTPAILRLTRRGSPLSVYTRLTSPEPRTTPSLPAWIGNRIEAVVAELYTAATGRALRADNRWHYHPLYEWIGCHVDRRAVGEPINVELKTRSRTTGWGPDGSAVIPADIWAQVQHQMACLGPAIRVTHVAVLFGLGHGFRVYVIPRDDEWIDGQMIPTLIEFRERFWLPGIPPAATGVDVDKALTTGPGGNTGEMIPATPEQSELAYVLRAARVEFGRAELAKKEAENRIRQLIGTADGIRGAFGVITLRRGKERHVVAWDYVAEAYAKALRDVLATASPGDDEAAVQALALAEGVLAGAEGMFTTVKEGIRTLRCAFVEDEDG